MPTPALAPLPHLAELSLALNNIKVNATYVVIVIAAFVVVVVAELSLALNNIKVGATCSNRHHSATS